MYLWEDTIQAVTTLSPNLLLYSPLSSRSPLVHLYLEVQKYLNICQKQYTRHFQSLNIFHNSLFQWMVCHHAPRCANQMCCLPWHHYLFNAIVQKISQENLTLKHLSDITTSPLSLYWQPLSCHIQQCLAGPIVITLYVLTHIWYFTYQPIPHSIYGVVF